MQTGTKFAAIVIALLLGSSALAAGPVVIPLKPYVGRLVTLDVRAGAATHPFLLDTGGGWTAVTPKLAPDLGCAPFGLLTSFRMSGEIVRSQKCGERSLRVGAIALAGEVAVFDLMSLLPKDLPELGGVFALASLAEQPFTLDLQERTLTLETPRSLAERTKGLEASRIRVGHESAGYGRTVFVEVAASPEPLWFLLDSGNLDAVAVAPHAVKMLGAAPEGDAASGKETFALNLRMAGQPVEGAAARVRDIIYDGAISEEVMRRFAITVDLARERIWLRPKPRPSMQ